MLLDVTGSKNRRVGGKPIVKNRYVNRTLNKQGGKPEVTFTKWWGGSKATTAENLVGCGIPLPGRNAKRIANNTKRKGGKRNFRNKMTMEHQKASLRKERTRKKTGKGEKRHQVLRTGERKHVGTETCGLATSIARKAKGAKEDAARVTEEKGERIRGQGQIALKPKRMGL